MNTFSHIQRRAVRRLALVASVMVMVWAVSAGCSGALPSPNNDLSTGQMMLDLNNAMVQLREDNAYLQSQIDSLHGAVAYQDTIIRQLAALGNVSVRQSTSSFPQ